jgi:hypothetical protein
MLLKIGLKTGLPDVKYLLHAFKLNNAKSLQERLIKTYQLINNAGINLFG